MADKFNIADRTFTTRLLFLKEIFENKYTSYDIMANCVEYKLGISYKHYLEELDQAVWQLNGQDPIKILKRLDS